jgi:hypothetical protein
MRGEEECWGRETRRKTKARRRERPNEGERVREEEGGREWQRRGKRRGRGRTREGEIKETCLSGQPGVKYTSSGQPGVPEERADI